MSPHLRRIPVLSLHALRLATWALLVLGLSIAPLHLTHVPAKYVGEAVGLAPDLTLDAEPEELDGDGADGPWFAPHNAFPQALLSAPCSQDETGRQSSCAHAPLPARGPPIYV